MKRKNPSIRKRKTFQRRGTFFVYILECSDGSFYTGYTNNLPERVKLHNKGGGSKYVKTRLPAKLIYSKRFQFYKQAVREERRIKTLTRKQKEGLVSSVGKDRSRKGKKR